MTGVSTSLPRRSIRRAPVPPRAAARPSDGTPRRPDLAALQGLRIALTLWLVVHHTTRWLLRDGSIDPETVELLREGQGATTGFFVLSGLILTIRWSARLADEPTIPRAADFLRRRWAAIWPLGTVGAIVAIPYELVEARLDPGELVVGFAAHLALVQSWFPVGGGIHGMSLRLNGPTWTLSTLLALYAAFPAIIWLVEARLRSRRALVALGVAPWLAIVGTAAALAGQPNAVWMLHVSPITRSADFLAGVALGTWILRHGAPRPSTARAAQGLGIALVAAAMACLVVVKPPRELGFGAMYIPPMALLVFGLTTRATPIDALLRTRGAQFAGKRAFALAMLHTPLLGLAWHAGLIDAARPLGTALTLLAAVALALVVHQWVEVPSRSRLRGAASPRQPGRRAEHGHPHPTR